MLPPKGGPNFKYSLEEGKEKTERHALSAELSNKVKGRQTAREIISWVEESVLSHHGLEATLTVVVQTLLDIGSKSFTHLIAILERYGQVIAQICHDQDKQIMLIAEVSSYWNNNAQMTAITIDTVMGCRLISNLAILRWVFFPDNTEQFHLPDRPWEAFHSNTLHTVICTQTHLSLPLLPSLLTSATTLSYQQDTIYMVVFCELPKISISHLIPPFSPFSDS